MTEHSHLEHRDRPTDEVAEDLRRARADHVRSAHDGDATACDCELVAFDADQDLVVADLTEDVDGLPLGVRVARLTMTGAHWRSRRKP